MRFFASLRMTNGVILRELNDRRISNFEIPEHQVMGVKRPSTRQEMLSLENIIVGITGASGIVYSQRLLQILNGKGFHIHLVISEAGIEVIRHELAIKSNADNLYLQHLLGVEKYCLTLYNISDIKAQISNGSFRIRGMVIVPCSMNTLGSIANGLTPNLISRAASVTLKEWRKLILVPRETPLTQIHLENMLRLARAGACILPAMPGFYHRPKTIEDQIDFVVAKILDQLQIGHDIDIRYYERQTDRQPDV